MYNQIAGYIINHGKDEKYSKNIRKIMANKILGILTRINFPFSGE